MSIDHVLAVVPVADFEAARAWYERLFGSGSRMRPSRIPTQCGSSFSPCTERLGGSWAQALRLAPQALLGDTKASSGSDHARAERNAATRAKAGGGGRARRPTSLTRRLSVRRWLGLGVGRWYDAS
jgi:hypothetical protein